MDTKSSSTSLILISAAVISFIVYCGSNMILLTYASLSSPALPNSTIALAESLHVAESLKVAPSVGTFVNLNR
ncbi:MAG: hypothetical protein ACRD47_14600 [Nitrososphaeraceae archaeon]